MVMFHLFILSTFPLAVPLEWNVLFGYATVFLFLGLPGLARLRRDQLSAALAARSHRGRPVVLPGPRQPAPGSGVFLPSMRQYAGNWASAMWAFAPGRRGQARTRSPGPPAIRSTSCVAPLRAPVADVTMQQTIAWRAMHSQGRGLFSMLMQAPARYRRLHHARSRVRLQLADRVQLRRRPPAQRGPDHRGAAPLRFEPGEFVVAWVESQPSTEAPALQGHRRRPRRDRARHVEGRRRGRRAALAAQRADPAAGDLARRVAHRPAAPPQCDGAARWRHEHRDRRGRRAERAGRRRGPGPAGRRGHGAGGGRRDRRRHPHQRADRARPAARPLLGVPPDGGRLARS